MNWSEIIQTVLPILLTAVIIPAITIIGKKAWDLIDEQIKDSHLKKYISIAGDCVIDSVEDVAHEYVDRLSTGEWNETTKKIALMKAKETVLTNIGTAGQQALSEALGDLDKWLDTKIKAEVQRRKTLVNLTKTTKWVTV